MHNQMHALLVSAEAFSVFVATATNNICWQLKVKICVRKVYGKMVGHAVDTAVATTDDSQQIIWDKCRKF